MSDRFLIRAWLCAASLALLAPQAHAQSTARQQARVSALTDSLRALGPSARPGRAPIELATDSFQAGALIVRSEPVLTPLARTATVQAWTILESTFGAGARALSASGVVFTLLAGQPRGNIVVVTTHVSRDSTSAGQSRGTLQDNNQLAKNLAWLAAVNLAAEFGPQVARWSEYDMWVESRRNDQQAANYFFNMATRRDSSMLACVQRQWQACRNFLELDVPVAGADIIKQTGYKQNLIGHLRQRLLAVVLTLGGPAAPQRFRQGDKPTVGEQLASAANVSEDSLFSAWRAEIARRPATLPRLTIGAAVALLLITMIGVAFTFRRPVVR